VAARPALAGIARSLFLREGASGAQVELLDAEGADGLPPVPDRAGADLLGLAHEALLAPADRKARGAHYTPPALADRLVALTLPPSAETVLDPACGGGAFLLAALRAGVPRVCGIDVDPLAVEVSQAAVALAGGRAELRRGDFLVLAEDEDAGTAQNAARTGGFDAVVGNPPFASPLRRGGTGELGAYTDLAGRFLVRSLSVVRPGGRVGLIQPQSVLTARDAAGVRDAVGDQVRALWVAEAKVFTAATNVVAVVAERDGRRRPVDLYGGVDVSPRGRATGSWGLLAARARGLPEVRLGGGPTVGSLATATAGFRAQYYGVVDHVTEGGHGSPLVTSGLIDVGSCAWGGRTTRIGRRTWTRPTLDVDLLDEPARSWFTARRVPKLLVATQTKVVEAVVDEHGDLLPSVPVISVEAPADRLWDLAAALMAPPVTAWLLERTIGSGLSADAVRLSAKLLLQVPLPTNRRAWTAARRELERGDRTGFAVQGCRAYGEDDQLAGWWLGRLP
jgi:SAM-dependent methyltransferase